MIRRHEAIVKLLAAQEEASVQELANHFGVSTMTIRRDLTALEQEGSLKRTHGGALLSKAGIVEFAFREKERHFAAEKNAIARQAASLVRPGMAVTLDTGTTTLEVARALANTKRLSILTSSLPIASVLYAHDNIELVLLGGTIRRDNPDLSGWLTEDNLKRFRVDLAILGADAVDPDGVLTTDVSIARVSQAMISNARETVLVIDHSKFEKGGFVKFASWNDIDIVISDDGVPNSIRQWLESVVEKVTYVTA